MKSKTGTREWATKNNNCFIGCKHNCIYCYARYNAVVRFKYVPSIEDWTNMHINERELKKKPYRLKEGRIMCPTTHDLLPEHTDIFIPYLRKWLAKGNDILIVTKPHEDVIKRICVELKEFKGQVVFRFTIGSMNNDVLRFWEPNAPDYNERYRALRLAYNEGWETSVSCEPYLDGDITSLVFELLPFVTDTIWIGKMNKIDSRVLNERINNIDWTQDEPKHYLDKVRENQTDSSIEGLYGELMDGTRYGDKIRWKDSIKEVLGLGEEEIG